MYRNSSRQFTSILLALIIAVMMMPAYTWADTGTAGAGSGTDPGSGQTRDVGSGGNAETTHIEHDGQMFAAWGNGTNEDISLPGMNIASGGGDSIYLTKDIVLENTWTVPYKNMKLCLNGHTIKLKDGVGGPVINVASGTSLDLYDCKGGGSIDGGNRSICVLVGGNAFTMHSGKLTGGYAESSSRGGGAVSLNAGASFNMNGGEISGNSAGSAGGGAIWADSGKIVINGGTISGNTSETSGGAVKTTGSSRFVMNGGTISGNFAAESGGGLFLGSTSELNAGTISNNGVQANSETRTGHGGGIAVGGKPVKLGKDIQISANKAQEGGAIYVSEKGGLQLNETTISNNEAVYGGAIYNTGSIDTVNATIKENRATNGGGGLYNTGEANINTTTISNNNAPHYMGGIFVKEGSIVLTDSTVTGNSGGAYVSPYEKLGVAGSTVIRDNGSSDDTGNTGIRNVYLQDESLIQAGQLTDGASIGVTTYVKPDESSSKVVFTRYYARNNPDVNPGRYFTSDDARYTIESADDEAAVSTHVHQWVITEKSKQDFPGYTADDQSEAQHSYAATIRCTADDSCDYNAPANIEIEIGEAQNEETYRSGVFTHTYNGNAAVARIKKSDNLPEGVIEINRKYYKSSGGELPAGEYPINAGVYRVQFEVSIAGSESSSDKVILDQKIVINPAEVRIEVYPYTNLAYTGSEQVLAGLVNESTVLQKGSMQYRLKKNGETESSWSESIPTARDSGRYTVDWKFTGKDGNYIDSLGSVTSMISEQHDHDDKYFVQWTATNKLPEVSQISSTEPSVFLMKNVDLDSSGLHIPSNNELNLCLNGKTVTGKNNTIIVEGNSTLRIYGHGGGKLTGFNGINVKSGATLELYDVVIDNCSNIGDNTGAVNVEGSGAVKIYDGKILNCHASRGAVNVSSSSANFEVHGSPVISNNTDTSTASKACNVYLASGAKIKVTDKLGEGSKIGITTEVSPTASATLDSPVTITSGYGYDTRNDIHPSEIFTVDAGNSLYYVGVKDTEAVLRYHKHEFKLEFKDKTKTSDNAAVIYCEAEGCPYETNRKYEISITAEAEEITDDDNGHGVKLNIDSELDEIIRSQESISHGDVRYYYKGTDDLVSADDKAHVDGEGDLPAKEGKEYEARLTITLNPHGDNQKNLTLAESFSIKEKPLPLAEVTLTEMPYLVPTGDPLQLVTVSGWSNAHIFHYVVDKSSPAETDWVTIDSRNYHLSDLPRATTAGQHTIYYYVEGETNGTDQTSSPNGSKEDPLEMTVTIHEHLHNWVLTKNEAGTTANVKCSIEGCDLKSDGYAVSIDMVDSFTGDTASYVYNGSMRSAKLTKADDFPTENAGVTVSDITYCEKTGDNEDVLKELSDAPASAGKYVAKATVTAKRTTESETTEPSQLTETIEQSFEITKADPSAIIEPVSGLVEDDEEHVLISASRVRGGTVFYRLGENGEWVDSAPKEAKAGEYDVYWYIKGNKNHNDLGSENAPNGPVHVEISGKDPDDDGSGGGDGGGGGGQDVDPDDGGKDGGKDTDPDDGGKDGGKDTDPDDGGDGDGTIDELVPVTLAKATAKGSNRIKVTWNNVKGAERYVVYLARCSGSKKEKTFKKVKTAKAPLRTWTTKKLKKNRYYKVRVIAQKKVDGKYQNISKSLIAHVYIGRGKLTNPKSIRLSKTKATIKAGKKYCVKGKVVKVNKKKKIRYKGHAAALRYVSSNRKIATVSKKGVIKAVSAGSCKVYVQGVNGVWKAFTVTVDQA